MANTITMPLFIQYEQLRNSYYLHKLLTVCMYMMTSLINSMNIFSTYGASLRLSTGFLFLQIHVYFSIYREEILIYLIDYSTVYMKHGAVPVKSTWPTSKNSFRNSFIFQTSLQTTTGLFWEQNRMGRYWTTSCCHRGPKETQENSLECIERYSVCFWVFSYACKYCYNLSLGFQTMISRP